MTGPEAAGASEASRKPTTGLAVALIGTLAAVTAGSTALLGAAAYRLIDLGGAVAIERGAGETEEGPTTARLVANFFYVLAFFVAIESVHGGSAREGDNWWGIPIAAALALATLRSARRTALLFTLALVAVTGGSLLGLWWPDPLVALGIVALAVARGRALAREDKRRRAVA